MSLLLPALLLLLGSGYVLLVAGLCRGVGRLRKGSAGGRPFVSVVIAARNEAARIDSCLAALAAQTYPSGRFEVVIADDGSTDGTAQRALAWKARLPVRVVRVTCRPFACRKKGALAAALAAARADILLTTDADCRPLPAWIESTVACFEEGVGMVAGPAPISGGEGLFGTLLSMQGLAVNALSAGSIGAGVPLTCSGRNLAYRRQAYLNAGGFGPFGHVEGGDDVYLMRAVATTTSWSIRYNPDPCAAVPSDAHEGRQLARQVRYQSKAARYGGAVLPVAVAVYILHLLVLAGPLLALTFPTVVPVLCAVGVCKALADGLYLWRASGVLGLRRLMPIFPLFEIALYPYVVIVCALGTLRRPSWT